MSYFKYFPTRQYIIKEQGGISKETIDIFRMVDLNDILSSDIVVYQYLDVTNGDRPDIISNNLYGDPKYYWTFFVTNDFLKNGIDSWPKSSNDLESYISFTYDNYGTLLITPNVLNEEIVLTDDESEVGNILKNNPGSIDVSYEYLYAERNGVTAKIKEWDPTLLQLKVYQFEDRDAFMEDNGAEVKLKIDPNFLRNQTWVDWMKMICQWRTDMIIDDLNKKEYLPINKFNEIFEEYRLNIIELSNQLYTFWLNYFYDLNLASFNVVELWDDSRKAPRIYYNQAGEEIDIITAIDTKNPIAYTYIQNFEYEEEQNLINSRIKYVKPEHIEEFVEEYKKLIK
jgi:hypothetical protein